MKRRSFLQMLGAAPAIPVLAAKAYAPIPQRAEVKAQQLIYMRAPSRYGMMCTVAEGELRAFSPTQWPTK